MVVNGLHVRFYKYHDPTQEARGWRPFASENKRYESHIDAHNVLTQDEIQAAASAIIDKGILTIGSVDINRIRNEAMLENMMDGILADSHRIMLRAPNANSEAGSEFANRLWEMQLKHERDMPKEECLSESDIHSAIDKLRQFKKKDHIEIQRALDFIRDNH